MKDLEAEGNEQGRYSRQDSRLLQGHFPRGRGRQGPVGQISSLGLIGGDPDDWFKVPSRGEPTLSLSIGWWPGAGHTRLHLGPGVSF